MIIYLVIVIRNNKLGWNFFKNTKNFIFYALCAEEKRLGCLAEKSQSPQKHKSFSPSSFWKLVNMIYI